MLLKLCKFRSPGFLHKVTAYLVNVEQTFCNSCKTTQKEDPVIFSGIQPTGIPHIGNYLGAIKYWVNLQNEPGTIYYSVVDLHSCTIPKSKSVLQCNIFDMTACLLACGIDPKRSILFLQSNVPEHATLAWIIGCYITVNKLKHLPQWKEKNKQLKDGGSLGVFTYPILQTADIILYKATHVPVANHSGKIRSLRDPTVKMSKSAPSEESRIELTDSNDVISKKIRRSVTDCTSQVTYDPDNRPGVSNLIEIHSGFANISHEEACALAVGMDTGQYKRIVADAVIATLSPFRDEYFRIRKDEEYLESILTEGSEKAREVASKNWKDIQQLMGMIR